MELKYSGQFRKDIAGRNIKLSIQIKKAIDDAKKATEPRKIPELKKLRKYHFHYRIKVGNYRIGIIIQNNKILFSRFGHRNLFYKKLFP